MGQRGLRMSPPPLRRLGPRPLPAHLAMAWLAWTSSIAGSTLLRNASPGSNGQTPPPPRPLNPRLAKLTAELFAHPPAEVAAALGQEIAHRLERMAAGILRYRHHPGRRDLPPRPTVWQEGTTRLVDYRPDGGPPLLVVPSLVNRAYVMDLSETRSFLRWLAAERGVRPLLVDWDAPGPIERGFDMTDYVAGRLDRALDAARAHTGAAALPVIGYCMGGTLIAALGQRRADAVSGLIFLATPWDFHAEADSAAHAQAAQSEQLISWIHSQGELPVDVLQTLFLAFDPLTAARKFRAFAEGDLYSPQAHAFVALEDWLNDGIPLVAKVAAEALDGWYRANTPATGAWKIAGEVVDPSRIACPSLHLIPSRDRIVPPPSSRALAAATPGADVLQPPLGHIGMMVGSAAPADAWVPIADWLESHPAA